MVALQFLKFMRKTPEARFWAWFRKNNNKLFHFEKNQDQVFARLRTALTKVHPGLTFEIGLIRNGKREFVISADGQKDAFAAVESLYAAAPVLRPGLSPNFVPVRRPVCSRWEIWNWIRRI